MSTGLGSFRVTADPQEVAAFRIATGLSIDRSADRDVLPLTYPMCWLVTPDVRAALRAMVREPDLVLVHESQSFMYQRKLHAREDYRLWLSARREGSPDRLVVDGEITDGNGELCASVETILRLFSTEAVAA